MTHTVTSRTGFHMKFENGWTVSVQWGKNNYCDSGGLTAEIAAWDSNRDWHYFEEVGNGVKGWATADEVADFIQEIKNKPGRKASLSG